MNSTKTQSKGLDSLKPIWEMIYTNENLYPGKGLNLSESDVSVTYERYINNYKNTTNDAQSNEKTVENAVQDGLKPGEKFKI